MFKGLIGRIALARGGFALRPASYTGDGEVIQTHPVWGKMVSPSRLQGLLQISKRLFKKGGKRRKCYFHDNRPQNTC